MDASTNSISNDGNEELSDLPDLLPLSPLIPPLLSIFQTPSWGSVRRRASTLPPIHSIFGQTINSSYIPLLPSSDSSNNLSNNNIIYNSDELYDVSTNINNILERSFGEQAHLYKKIISKQGKEDIHFSLFDTKKCSEAVCAITRCPFEEGEEIATLPCKHVFNKEAIMTWLEEKSASCPVCRYALDDKEVKKPPLLNTPTARAAVGTSANRRRLRHMLYDMLDLRLQEDEEERIQRAILQSLRDINPD